MSWRNGGGIMQHSRQLIFLRAKTPLCTYSKGERLTMYIWFYLVPWDFGPSHHWGLVPLVKARQKILCRTFSKIQTSTKHVSIGIIWIQRNHCSCVSFAWQRMIVPYDNLTSVLQLQRHNAAGQQPCPRSQFILCASPLFWLFQRQFFYSISISSGLTHWIFPLHICVPSGASAWIAE